MEREATNILTILKCSRFPFRKSLLCVSPRVVVMLLMPIFWWISKKAVCHHVPFPFPVSFASHSPSFFSLGVTSMTHCTLSTLLWMKKKFPPLSPFFIECEVGFEFCYPLAAGYIPEAEWKLITSSRHGHFLAYAYAACRDHWWTGGRCICLPWRCL